MPRNKIPSPRLRGLRQAANKWRSIFARSAAWTLVFVLAAVLFNWPFFSRVQPWAGVVMFKFLMLAWAVVIALLFCIGMGAPPGRRGDRTDSD